MNLPAKLFLFVLLTSICLFLGFIAFNTRHRQAPKDFTVLKKDLIELEHGSRVSVEAAAFTMVAFVEPLRFGRALETLHNDVKLQPDPKPSTISMAAITNVLAVAVFVHLGATHLQGPDKISYEKTRDMQKTFVVACEQAFQSLEAEEKESQR